MNRKAAIALIILFALSIGSSGEIFYPWKEVIIGSLDGFAWPGVVLAPSRDSVFAFVIKVEKEGQTAEKEDFFYLVSEVGPQAPDGQYARLRLDLSLPFKEEEKTPVMIKPGPRSATLTLEWSRRDEKTVLGRIQYPKDINLSLVHYFPWENSGEYTVSPEGYVQGISGAENKHHYYLWTSRKGRRRSNSEGANLELAFPAGGERVLHFAAGVGDDLQVVKNHVYRYQNAATIQTILEEENAAYLKKRTRIKGLYQGAAEALTNSIFWTVLYQPGHHRFYTPAGRQWIFRKRDRTRDPWQIFAWDSFLNALELAVESPKHAVDVVSSVLETQYPNGNIPNWRALTWGTPDRSQPPIGSFVVMKLFQRLGDTEFLKKAYPYLEKWHEFWTARKPTGQARRDGNGDGLLEWGSDEDLVAKVVPIWEEKATGKQRAKWESGQDDLPNWDDAGFSGETGTLTMNCLDLNCLYALDAWCLSQIAGILGNDKANSEFLEEYEKMKKLVNASLWNEKEGFYFDRHWDGRFSPRKAASSFYPLLARIPDEKRAMRMIKQLMDPKKFWGDYVIPSISRDDPAFKDQQYWRGTIWSPTNYLVYQGLKAYGFDAIASAFAKKSSDLLLRTWESFQICPENFDSRTGEAGGNRYQSWSSLFALVALEEYLDFNPWEGFRFGMLKPERGGRLSRTAIQGRHYEVVVNNDETILREEGNDILEANRGAVFRHFLYNENEVSFEIKSLENEATRLRIWFIKKGKYQLLIDEQEVKIFEGKSVKFEVPGGEHSVLIQLLEEKE